MPLTITSAFKWKRASFFHFISLGVLSVVAIGCTTYKPTPISSSPILDNKYLNALTVCSGGITSKQTNLRIAVAIEERGGDISAGFEDELRGILVLDENILNSSNDKIIDSENIVRIQEQYIDCIRHVIPIVDNKSVQEAVSQGVKSGIQTLEKKELPAYALQVSDIEFTYEKRYRVNFIEKIQELISQYDGDVSLESISETEIMPILLIYNDIFSEEYGLASASIKNLTEEIIRDIQVPFTLFTTMDKFKGVIYSAEFDLKPNQKITTEIEFQISNIGRVEVNGVIGEI